MKLLLHTDDEVVHARIDINSYTLPPGEPVEIENDHHANLILEQKVFHGIVEVPTIKSRTGISYDIDSAIATSKEALLAADDLVVAQYIRTQLEDRLGAGKPALAPQGRALKIIRRTKTDLADYGIMPVGWKQSEAPGRGGRAAVFIDDKRPKSEREKQLEELLAESNRQLAAIGLEKLGNRGEAPPEVQAALEQQRGQQGDTEPPEEVPGSDEPVELTEEQAGEAAAAAVEQGEGGLPIAPRAATLASQRNRNRARR